MRLSCQVFFARVLLAIALWASLAGCAAQKLVVEDRPAHSGNRLLLPTTGSGAPFLLTAQVNGVGPYSFVLDTGSTSTIVSQRLVEELELTPSHTDTLVLDAEGQPVALRGAVQVNNITFGPVAAHAVDALVIDLSRFERALGQPVDGIAPAALFADFTLVIDYAAAQVWCTPDRLRTGVKMQPGRLPVVRADIAGHAVDVLIDSGSGGSWMVPTTNLPVEQVGYPDRQVEQADQTRRRARAELQGVIRVGNQVFDRPIVEETSGIARVGWHALRGHRVAIDHRSRRITLHRVAQTVNEPLWGIGARLVRVGDVWEVRSVEPGLPAASAGLKDGERILSIEGRHADTLDEPELAAIIQQSPRLRLEVMRVQGIETVWVPIVYLQP